MAAIRRKSTILIIISICLIIVMSSGSFYTMFITHTIKSDAEIINKLGGIRGSIQRLVKLEVSGNLDDELINNIDSFFGYFTDKEIVVYDEQSNVMHAIDDLFVSWEELKAVIFHHREYSTAESEQRLLNLSERIWTQSNSMVLTSQLNAERKIDKYSRSYLFYGVNLLLGLVIIFMIKRHVKDTLEYLVNYDSLTKIHNRRYYNEFLSREISRADRYKKDLSLIMFDIDRFKGINDTYGHDVGDSVLKELAQLIKKNIRKDDLLARLGGEEFAVIVPENNIEKTLLLAEKLREVVEGHEFKHVGNLTISLGIAEYSKGDDLNKLYKKVDTALYKAKNNGRNRCEVFEEGNMDLAIK